jgi:TRAP-type transport system small permease protein
MRVLRAGLEGAAAALLLALVLVALLQVGSRYTGLVFVPWTEELSRVLFVWVIWLGAAAASARGAHIRFDLVVKRLPGGAARRLRGIVELAGACFLAAVAWYGWQVARSQANTRFLTFDLSVQYVYLAAVVGAVLMIAGMAASRLGERGTARP